MKKVGLCWRDWNQSHTYLLTSCGASVSPLQRLALGLKLILRLDSTFCPSFYILSLPLSSSGYRQLLFARIVRPHIPCPHLHYSQGNLEVLHSRMGLFAHSKLPCQFQVPETKSVLCFAIPASGNYWAELRTTRSERLATLSSLKESETVRLEGLWVVRQDARYLQLGVSVIKLSNQKVEYIENLLLLAQVPSLFHNCFRGRRAASLAPARPSRALCADDPKAIVLLPPPALAGLSRNEGT